ncbi:MAG: pantoate--beta-alanine ligase [Phycisphaerales bacterium]
MLPILRTIAEFEAWRAARSSVLVPTMGALHAGHAALIRRAAREARQRGLHAGCLVWIFVNPTQFNSPGDLARYPRTLDQDARLCREAGASAIFAPSADLVYPPGTTIPTPPLPGVATQPRLEDAFRPGHFAGVCQVVKRMFDLCRPQAAIFGEKDWQQLAVVLAMVRQERLGVEIIPEPTVREADGLAMSSRNVFLNAADRARALAISRALGSASALTTAPAAEARMREVLASAAITPEYAVVRDAGTLGQPIDGRPARALIAAMVGSTRLIDNAAWP